MFLTLRNKRKARSDNSGIAGAKQSLVWGFTMIEMLVTVGIFALITSAVLVNYPKFSSTIVLENVAHQVALSVRQAQSYGLNVQGVESGGTVGTFPTYGVHFGLGDLNPGLPTDPSDTKHFLLFADLYPSSSDPTNNNKRYDAQSSCSTGTAVGECVELFTVQSVNGIYMLCGNLKSHQGATYENWQEYSEGSDGANCNLSSLDIAYTRPDPDAIITGHDPDLGSGEDGYDTFTNATIVIRSPRGDTRLVNVWNTGQIAIE